MDNLIFNPYFERWGWFEDLRKHLHGILYDEKNVLKLIIMAQITQAMTKLYILNVSWSGNQCL